MSEAGITWPVLSCYQHSTSSVPQESFVVADPFRGGVKVLVTGPHGFARTLTFALDEDPALIAERVLESSSEGWIDAAGEVSQSPRLIHVGTGESGRY